MLEVEDDDLFDVIKNIWNVHEDIWAPPPTFSVCPVIHWLSELANKAITPLISSGEPGRPSGLQSLSTLSICSSVNLSPPGMYLAAASAVRRDRERRDQSENELTVHICFNSTWSNTIHSDISRSKIIGKTTNHILNSRFGSPIDTMSWNTLDVKQMRIYNLVWKYTLWAEIDDMRIRRPLSLKCL
jgi:hypothetical protein